MDQRSHNALSHHGVGDLQEAGNVGAEHHVARLAALDGGVVAGLKDALHDAVQLLVHFLEAPAHTQRVLAHFQTGGGDAARVGSLARRVEQAGLDDRVIEVVKCFMTDAFLAENRFYRKVQLRFLKGSSEHSFYVLGTEGEVLTRILLDMDYYAMVRDVMKLDEIDEAVVNEAWADDYIRSHIEDFK